MTETQDDKQARLAQALRDNLRRRKVQARAATPSDAPTMPTEDAAKDGA